MIKYPDYIRTPIEMLEYIQVVFARCDIEFSRTIAARLVGGEKRLNALIEKGDVAVEKRNTGKNAKWRCKGADIIGNIKL